METEIRSALAEALEACFPDVAGSVGPLELSVPRERSHGDYATNAAMILTGALRRPPRTIAEPLAEALRARDDLFADVEIAGPGFINFRVAPRRLQQGLADILAAGPAWGQSTAGAGQRVQVEYVSANPTGPLNVVNARAAAFGGVLTRLLAVSGHDAASEFYVNNVGGQIDLLGQSLLARFHESQGQGPAEIPEQGYRGEYLKGLAASLDGSVADSLADLTPEEQSRVMATTAVDRIQAWQRKDLESYGCTFDRWFRQSELYPRGIESALSRLKERGHVYEKDDAQWFRSTDFQDDQDRVLVRNNGEPTYFLADLAYHTDKHDRGFTTAIDIWGPDHHGYIGRMQAAMEAYGFGRNWLEVLIIQQVNLLSDGKQVKMSKRAGEFITLEDLLEDVGRDTAIFFFLMRRAESHLDFDLDLARQQSDENPVFYVKYAHARIAGVLRKAVEENAPDWEGADLSRLNAEQEMALLKVLLQFPALLAGAAAAREPHRLTLYLREVAQTFHLFYHHCRVLGPDLELTRARLALARAARQVVANGLGLLGIDAPERM